MFLGRTISVPAGGTWPGPEVFTSFLAPLRISQVFTSFLAPFLAPFSQVFLPKPKRILRAYQQWSNTYDVKWCVPPPYIDISEYLRMFQLCSNTDATYRFEVRLSRRCACEPNFRCPTSMRSQFPTDATHSLHFFLEIDSFTTGHSLKTWTEILVCHAGTKFPRCDAKIQYLLQIMVIPDINMNLWFWIFGQSMWDMVLEFWTVHVGHSFGVFGNSAPCWFGFHAGPHYSNPFRYMAGRNTISVRARDPPYMPLRIRKTTPIPTSSAPVKVARYSKDTVVELRFRLVSFRGLLYGGWPN